MEGLLAVVKHVESLRHLHLTECIVDVRLVLYLSLRRQRRLANLSQDAVQVDREEVHRSPVFGLSEGLCHF